MSSLLDLDRTLVATWRTYASVLEDALRSNDLTDALTLIRSCRDDAWLGINDSDFIVLAAAVAARAGDANEAIGLVEQAHRYGHPRFFLFDAGWGSHGIARDTDGHWTIGGATLTREGPFALHALLSALYDAPEIVAFVRDHFSATVDLDGSRRPLAWFEETTVSRTGARCALSGRALAKGSPAYGYRVWSGPFDIATDLVLADRAAFDADRTACARRDKFLGDAQSLADFVPPGPFDHPSVNAFFRASAAATLDDGLRVVAEAPAHPTPWALGDEWGPAVSATKTRTFAGAAGELVDLLWVLVKCGHLRAIVDRLPELPPFFPLLLMLFDRPKLREAMAAHLGAPELTHLFSLIGSPRLGAQDRARLVRFGIEHPRVSELVASMLERYEVHLYSNYQCSPNWFFQDFHALARGRGRSFVYLLAAYPDRLAPLAAMRKAHARVRRPDLSVTGIAYDDIDATLLEVAMLADALAGAPDEWPREDPERARRPIDSARRAAAATAKHLGLRMTPASAPGAATEPASENAFVARAEKMVRALERGGRIEIAKRRIADVIDDVADALAAGADGAALEELLLEHSGVEELYANAAEIDAADG